MFTSSLQYKDTIHKKAALCHTAVIRGLEGQEDFLRARGQEGVSLSPECGKEADLQKDRTLSDAGMSHQETS